MSMHRTVAIIALVVYPGLAEGQAARSSNFVHAGASVALPGPAIQRATPRCERGGWRMGAQYAGALAGAWVGGMAAWKAFDDPYAPDRKVKGDAGYTPNANTAFALGSWIGSAGLAIAIAPRGMGCRPHYTALGTAVPTTLLLAGRDEPYLPLIGIAVVAPIQALAAMLSH
jgi:hypothetical protein